MHFITLFDILIVNFILGAFYIFYGFYKKRDSFTNLGLIVLLLTLIINASKLFDNISITYVLLIIGILMLTYVFYLEAKKKKIKE